MKVPFSWSLTSKAVRDTWQKKWDADEKGRHHYSIQKAINMKDFKGKRGSDYFKAKTWTYWIQIRSLLNGKVHV